MLDRIGEFTVSRRMIEDHPEEVITMFHKLGILVIRAELLYQYDAVQYTAFSESFEKVNLGEVTPRYDIRIEGAGTGNVTFIIEKL